MLMKIAKWALIVFLVFFVVTQPESAAHVFHSILDLGKQMALGFSALIANLA
jgi:hypothetical protein